MIGTTTMRDLRFGFGRRLPVVLQAEAAECGMACLAMVLGYHGHQIDLATLRRRHQLSLKGMTLRALAGLSAKMNLASRALRLEIGDLPRLQLPCILHWGLNHFVVLQKVGPRHLVVHDPARGRRTVPLGEASREFTGIALELSPTTGFIKERIAPGLTLRQMFRKVSGLAPTLLQILLLSLGIELVAVLLPLASQVIVDEVVVNSDRDLLLVVGVGMALLLLMQLALGAARTWSIMVLGATLNYRWSGSVFDRLRRLPLDYFEKRHPGDILSRFGSLLTIEKALTTDLFQSVLDGLMSAMMLAIIFVYSAKLAFVVVGFALANVIIRLLAARSYRENTEAATVADARQESHFLETIRGMATIKLLSLGERRRSTWMNQFVAALNARLSLQRADLVFGRADDLLAGGCHLVLLIFGARAVIDHSMSFGMLVAFLAYANEFAHRTNTLAQSLFHIKMLGVQTDRLSDIVLSEPEPDMDALSLDDRDDLPCPAVKRSDVHLAATGLALRYDADGPWVFRSLSLKVPYGACYAITGPSGCGKTTLMKILMGLMRPSEGSVFVEGRDIRLSGALRHRQRIAGVMQNDQLFAGSIAENIACFDEDMDMGWVEECAARAAILDDISRTPMGFETLVGDMGSTLSGGQRQRVILARALYRRPHMLFLDEATSHLDEQTESRIADTLKDLSMTRIVIAHRPATIAHSDEVLSLPGVALAA